MSTDTQQDAEFIAPTNGGWHYSLLRDWIAVCPDLSPSSVRLYWIIRSLMHEKGDRSRRLSLDQLAFLMPGVNGKPTGLTRVKDSVRELTSAGLLSNPDDEVQRRWVTDPQSGKRTRENFRRWQVHDYPADEYGGYRSAMAKLDNYSPDWRSQLVDNSESRNSDSQAESSPSPAKTQKTAGHTESRNSDSMRRNSDSMRRNSADNDAQTGENAELNKPPQSTGINNHPPRAHTRGTDPDGEPDVVGGGESSSGDGGDIHELVGEIADAMAMGASEHEAGDQEQPTSTSAAHKLLEQLRAQDGSWLSSRARREYEPLVSRLLEQHRAIDIAEHLTSGIKQGGGIRYRLEQLKAGNTTVGFGSGSSPSSAPSSSAPSPAPVEIPPVCGQCDARPGEPVTMRRIRPNEKDPLQKCPRCHPQHAATAA